MKARSYATVLPLLASGLLIAACGSSSPSAGTNPQASPSLQTVGHIVPAMQAAVKHATSVHITGTVQADSKQLSLDVSFRGSDVSGTVTEDGQTYIILLVANKAYYKVDPAFLKTAGVPASVCRRVCGKYVSAPASEVALLSRSLSMTALTRQWLKSFPSSIAHNTADHFTPATLDGQPVLKVTQGRYTIEVAGTGAPYPVFISQSKNGSATFSEWNAVPPINPPPASQVVSLSSL